MNDNAKRSRPSAALRSPGPLQGLILSFDLNSEIKRLRAEEPWQGGRNSKTLVKHSDFRVVLTVLKSNARLHDHKAAGSISVQTVEGHIRMHVDDQLFDLPTGHLLALDYGVVHDVEAVEDSAFLLTIVFPEADKG